MLTIILGASGHGKINYALTQTVEKAHDKKILIISNELSPDLVLSRLDKILKYNKDISPSEIRIISKFTLADLSIGKDYDVVTILGYMPPYSDKFSCNTAMQSYKFLLEGMINGDPNKEIISTLQIARPTTDCSFSKIQESFFSSDFQTSENYNHILIHRDSESESFRILSLHDKSVKTINKLDFFCES